MVKDLENARKRVKILEKEKGEIAVELINTSNGRIEKVPIEAHEELQEEINQLRAELKSKTMNNDILTKKNSHLKKKSEKLEEELQLICHEYKVMLGKQKLNSLRPHNPSKEMLV